MASLAPENLRGFNFQAFEMLDVDEDGELSIDEFTAGLSQLQERHPIAMQTSSVELVQQVDWFPRLRLI